MTPDQLLEQLDNCLAAIWAALTDLPLDEQVRLIQAAHAFCHNEALDFSMWLYEYQREVRKGKQ